MTDLDDALKELPRSVDPFALTLHRHNLELKRARTTILQVNVALLCNLTCKHCHLEAGPQRSEEVMNLGTMEKVAAFAERGSFEVVDVTGGAPELNSNIVAFIELLAAGQKTVMFRSNLTILTDEKRRELLESCCRHRVAIVGSLPSLNVNQLEAQRGSGVLEKILTALKRLNSIGYGQPGTGLQLDLVCNPTGAFLPSSQHGTERKFRFDLQKKWGIVFSNLYTFANVPLGRFRQWLSASGNIDKYMEKLASSFNPCTLEGLMCQKLVSVSWDGYLYDCDFNLAAGIPLGGARNHVSAMEGPPMPGTPIAVSDHCYACTAGAGFT
ncbi:MAG: arsenosugar biosynthesis radical SAM protein ArsS [Desulfomonile tiedjei]|nr:arsenosugar biosynthesis radical SAM protein ArsS [Desulfomonile tiedjei]